MKIYTGNREGSGAVVRVNGTLLPLEPSLHVRDHSPTGFEWGYGGSGPSQLALAILLDACGEVIARQYYQHFKSDFIAKASYEGFVISSLDIDAWVEKKIKEEPLEDW